MDVSELLSLLAAHRDDRGITNWNKMAGGPARLSTFGIGLSRLRQLAKQVGRNRELALKLWQTDVYDARVIALLIDDPAAITREQAESQVDELGDGQLTHVFSSCGSSLARTPFVVELVDAWTVSPDRTRRSCGYGLLSEVAQFTGKKAPSDDYFLAHVSRIEQGIAGESGDIPLAMAGALMSIGKRNPVLHAAALKVARKVGPVTFDSPSGRCEPFDVVKHLTTDRLKRKLGVD